MTRQIQLTWASLRGRRPDPSMSVLGPSTTRMRVHPGDLDFYRHVNNGTYLQMMDVARSNYLADLGALGALRERAWYPVVAASTVKYRRSLTLWERFTITTTLAGWDERVVYLEQVFHRGQDLAARGWVAGRFLTRGGARVPAPDVVEYLAAHQGVDIERPELPAAMHTWAHALDVAAR